MVSIAAFQAVDPGSIPGRRNILAKDYLLKIASEKNIFVVSNDIADWKILTKQKAPVIMKHVKHKV